MLTGNEKMKFECLLLMDKIWKLRNELGDRGSEMVITEIYDRLMLTVEPL